MIGNNFFLRGTWAFSVVSTNTALKSYSKFTNNILIRNLGNRPRFSCATGCGWSASSCGPAARPSLPSPSPCTPPSRSSRTATRPTPPSASSPPSAFVSSNWARIFKRLWSPGIDSEEWIPPAYVAWRAYDKPIPTQFLAPIDCLKIPALYSVHTCSHS